MLNGLEHQESTKWFVQDLEVMRSNPGTSKLEFLLFYQFFLTNKSVTNSIMSKGRPLYVRESHPELQWKSSIEIIDFSYIKPNDLNSNNFT